LCCAEAEGEIKSFYVDEGDFNRVVILVKEVQRRGGNAPKILILKPVDKMYHNAAPARGGREGVRKIIWNQETILSQLSIPSVCVLARCFFLVRRIFE